MIGIHELIFLALAGYRLTQLGVHDTILDPVRDRVIDWQTRRPESSLRAAIVTLITCVYCTGWWLSGAALLTYLLATGQWHAAPLLVHGLEWFAVAGGAVLLNRWDDSRKAAS
ncbi:DUF1360 domain-containing protein [Streptomyces sp. LBUM 1478]|uniref:DUF1360 domain-containing protein n=1 Tax=Streptomyces scabiei TaxID=1930 RepID=UPI0007660C7E|nr:DUF1360 domain-containing protein [Streptomyces scabiei]MBP5906794.1 DUF1360 domain-containing protein [Streptomyces sp. LBUM 1478]